MCNMAAFVGETPAAPVLLRMLERQEGLWSGHFSGISTLHDGKIYTARVCGDVARLRRETDAEKLPGTIGIVHSRTPGAPPLATWSHPFPVGEKLAFCSNGSPGCFAGMPDFPKLLQELTERGVRFLSECDKQAEENRPALANGHAIHVSEMQAQLLADAHFREGLPLIAALRRIFGKAPSEIASLAIAADEPDHVAAVRFNQPLMWCRRGNESFLATSSLAFPDDIAGSAAAIPACTTLTMTGTQLVIEPMPEHAEYLLPDTGFFRATEIMDGMLSSGMAFSVSEFNTEILKSARKGRAEQRALAIYTYLYEKLHDGLIERIDTRVPASLPGAEAPLWRFRQVRKPFSSWTSAQ